MRRETLKFCDLVHLIFEIFYGMLSVQHSQYHACWCIGDFRSQCISRHGIDPTKLGYSVSSIRRVNLCGCYECPVDNWWVNCAEITGSSWLDRSTLEREGAGGGGGFQFSRNGYISVYSWVCHLIHVLRLRVGWHMYIGMFVYGFLIRRLCVHDDVIKWKHFPH